MFTIQFYTFCKANPACVVLIPFVGGRWSDILAEGTVFAAFNKVADAVKSGDWRGTAIEPGVECDAPTAELFQIPCDPAAALPTPTPAAAVAASTAGGASAAAGAGTGRCNAVLAGVHLCGF